MVTSKLPAARALMPHAYLERRRPGNAVRRTDDRAWTLPGEWRILTGHDGTTAPGPEDRGPRERRRARGVPRRRGRRAGRVRGAPRGAVRRRDGGAARRDRAP